MKKQCCGFTLIELVVTMVIISISGIFIFSALYSVGRAYDMTHTSQSLHEEAGMAIEKSAREMRDAIAIAVTSPYNITVTKVHSTPQDSRTAITYVQNSGEAALQRGSAGDYRKLATSLVVNTGFSVTLDDNGTPSTTWDDAYKLKISFVNRGTTMIRSIFVSPRNTQWSTDPTNFDFHYKSRVYHGDYQDAAQ